MIGDLGILREQLRSVAEQMSNRGPDALEIVILRYGLGGENAFNLEQVARRLGYTRERIRHVQREFLRRLRYPSYSRPMRAAFFIHAAKPFPVLPPWLDEILDVLERR